jgi:cell division protein FtsN
LARNDDGEFELILGNRQLVSVFLIVVILLGVFFSMGYIVGRNSSPLITADSRTAKPIVVDNPARAAAPPAEEPAAPAESSPPAKEIEKPSPTRPAETPTESKPVAAKHPETKPASVGEPAAGTYLQVVATTRADAEIVAESLVKKGFKAMVAPVPGSALNRVLVGPVKDAGDTADVRTRLEAAGFKPYVRKY